MLSVDQLFLRSSKFHDQAVRKKEVKANDLTGTIKVTLWGDIIDAVGNTNGTFKLSNLVIKEPTQDLIVLYSTSSTLVETADMIECSSTLIPDLVISQYQLPALSVKLEKHFICSKCNNSFKSNAAKLLQCTHCFNKVLQSTAKYYYQGSMIVKDKNNKDTEIMVYRHQFYAYYKLLGMLLPQDEDDVVISFLSDDQHVILCNSRNHLHRF